MGGGLCFSGQALPFGLGQAVVDGHQGLGRDRLPGAGQLQGLAGHPPGGLLAQVGGRQAGGDARGGEGVIAQLGAIPHHQLGGAAALELLDEVSQGDGPVGGQPPGGGAVHLEAGVVDLMPPGVHGCAHLAGEARQVPGHGLQGGAAGAGELGGPRQPLGRRHADAQAGEGAGARRHGDQVQLPYSQAAVGQQPLGLIRVDIAARDLKNILEGDEDTQVVLLSEAEELLYTSLPSGEWREALERLRPSRVTVSRRSRQFGFSLTSLAPKDQLKRNIRRTLLTMILLTGAFGALIPFITELITRNSMKPISEINQLMKEVRAGDLSVRAKVETGGEFAEVCDSFNKMIINTEQLIRQVKLQEREKMEAEYQALQAQISPHFMLNTLNTIKWMAVIQGARTIEQALNAFSQLLSFAVREKSEKIPIRKELDMMRYYTEILSLRYFDRFRIRYDVDKAALDCCTLKYILQTLVENSIFHGLDLVERSIEIRVQIRREPDRIVYEVQDNGAGMSPARIEEVLHQKHLKGKGMMKIGLYNIQQRIRLVFGEEYGISIRSEEGAYTVVRVEIPVLEAEDVSDSDR